MATTKITTPELFDFSDLNTALQLPSGNNASRPSAPSDGEWRFNTEEKYIEYYDSGTTAWYQIDTEAIPNPDDFPQQNFNITTYSGSGATQTIDAKFNEAANFKSTGSYITANTWGFDASTDASLTFSFWIKLHTLPSSGTNINIVQDIGSTSSAFQLYMYGVATGHTISFQRVFGGNYYYNSGYNSTAALYTGFTVNTWFNIAITYASSSQDVNVYVNGSQTGVSNANYTLNTTVGASTVSTQSRLAAPNGALDQVRVFNTTLTAAQAEDLYTDETTTTAATLDFPAGAGCVAAYQLDGDASDLSGTYGGFTTDVGYSGLQFQPDFVWTKMRSSANNHQLFDSVRGVTKELESNTTAQEVTNADSLTAFNSNGFTVGSSNNENQSGVDYVAWSFKGGGAPTATNSAGAGNVPTSGSVKIDQADSSAALSGSIAATKISANTKAGLSIVSYTGDGNASASVAHGLNASPNLWIIKERNGTQNWVVGSSSLGATDRYLILDSDSEEKTNAPNIWSVSSSVITFPTSYSATNNNTSTYVGYFFHNVTGYQKIGTYTGTGSDKGNYIFTDSNGDGTGNDGFEPAFLLVKRTDDTAGWFIYDNKRVYGSEAPGNALDGELRPNEDFAEDDYSGYNFYSNGFEVANSGTNMNANGGTYVYLAIAANKDSSVPTAANSFVNTTYTGTNATQNIYTPFKPDFVWTKVTSTTNSHYSFDSVRGRDLAIYPDLTFDETAEANSLLSFAPNGFQIGSAGGVSSAFPRVAWNWKAGGMASLNVTGDIPAIISANQAGGFSVVRYRGNGGSGQTVAHGLSQAPTYVIFKNLTDSVNWFVWIYDTGSSTYKRLEGLNTNPIAASVTSFGADASKITWSGTPSDFNTLNKDYVMYCWHSVASYSQMGIYNGSSSDVVVSTGFQPTFVMVKNLDAAVPWGMVSNQYTGIIYADSSGGESDTSSSYLTLNSNNFTLIGGTGSYFNTSGNDYVYMAFA